VILSLPHFLLTIRALLRSVAERYVLGIACGILRAALLVAGEVIAFVHGSIISPSPLRFVLGAPTNAAPSLAVSVGVVAIVVVSPVVTFGVLWSSYRRFHEAPAALEAKLRRPFSAWLPVGVLEAMFVVATVASFAFAASRDV
jgi:hypothetical protein